MENKLTDIIIVEDNDLFRESLCNFINQSGELICTHSFINCETAIDTINNVELIPEVILLDIGLPGMSGIDGIKRFLNLLPEVKIIILTIQDDDDSIFNALCNGASGYLLKDSDSGDIISSVNEVLNGGAPINSSIANKVLKMFRDFIPEHNDYRLSDRELEILKLLSEGLSKKQISEKIFISHHTVDSHIRHIYEKLEVHSSCEAVAIAIKERLI